jgi:hypothetical protein
VIFGSANPTGRPTARNDQSELFSALGCTVKNNADAGRKIVAMAKPSQIIHDLLEWKFQSEHQREGPKNHRLENQKSIHRGIEKRAKTSSPESCFKKAKRLK